MKKKNLIKIMAIALLMGTSCGTTAGTSSSPDLKSILGAGGGAISNILEGVFGQTDLTVADIAGEWKTTGSAVTFKSDNLLKKAGGMAAAGAVESKLNEYYSKYGLNNLTFSVNPDGTFGLGIKSVTLKGTITVKDKGVFNLKFTALGGFSLGSMDAYIEKTGNNLNLMFDADKIKNILSIAATLSGSKLVSTADSVLKEYDGICMGFKMTKTANATTTSESEKTPQSVGLDALKGLFGK